MIGKIFTRIKNALAQRNTMHIVGGVVIFFLTFLAFIFHNTTLYRHQIASLVLFDHNIVDTIPIVSHFEGDRRIIVKYKDNVSDTQKVGLALRHTLIAKGVIPQLGIAFYAVSADDTAFEVVDRIRTHESAVVEFVEVDRNITLLNQSSNLATAVGQKLADASVHISLARAGEHADTLIGIAGAGVDCLDKKFAPQCISGRSFFEYNDLVEDVTGHDTLIVSELFSSHSGDNVESGLQKFSAKVVPLRVTDDVGVASFSSVSSAIVYAINMEIPLIYSAYVTNESMAMRSVAEYVAQRGGLLLGGMGEPVAFPILTPQKPIDDLTITNAIVLSKTKSSAMISWSTNLPSKGYVEYWSSLGSVGQISPDSHDGTEHATALSSLLPGTTYFYQIVVTLPDGTKATPSPLSTFRTTRG